MKDSKCSDQAGTSRRQFIKSTAAVAVGGALLSEPALGAAAQADAADWGSLKGRLIYDGKAPVPKKITPTQDVIDCGDYELFEEMLLVDKGGGLANVAICLFPERGDSVDVHPDYTATEKADVVLDNADFRFKPHICLMRTTQTLVIKNSDPIGHNVYCHLMRNAEFNEIVAVGKSTKKTLSEVERFPVKVDCTVHPWEIAYLVLRDHPYMAASAKDGTFEIKNIPAGEHEFRFWHENPGIIRDLSVGGDKTSRRGCVKLTIPAGGTLDLGTIKIDPRLLMSK